MTIFSILFLGLAYLQSSGLEDTLHSLAAPAQLFCKSLLNSPSTHLSFYQAIACGTRVKGDTYDILKEVSLWHLVVVSAGHFQLLQWIFKKLIPQYPRLHFLLLFGFCFWTGAQPPLIRAYFDLLLQTTSQRLKLWIPNSYSILYGCCFGLCLFPTWCHSWSFLLSWLCALLVLLFKDQPKILQALGISIGVYPIMLLFTPPHPLSFFFNFVFGPPLSLVLFPLSLIMTVLPAAHLLADPLMDLLLKILPWLAGSPDRPPISIAPNAYQLKLCWAYVLTLQIWLILRQRFTWKEHVK